jgi:hypothetical protein
LLTKDNELSIKYIENIKDIEKNSEKISLIKDLLNIYSSKYDKKNIKKELKTNNETSIEEKNIKSKLDEKFPNYKNDINFYMGAREDIKTVMQENEGILNFDLNESYLGILEK